MARLPLTVVVVVALLAPAAECADKKKVLFVGIDGCRYDAIQYSQSKHLKELARDGAASIPVSRKEDRRRIPELHPSTKTNELNGPATTTTHQHTAFSPAPAAPTWTNSHNTIDRP